MLDLRRTAVPIGPARLALAAVLTIICALAAASAAHAATGELATFGPSGFGADQASYAGPVAVDPTDGDSIYVSDVSDGGLTPRIRKFAADGTRLATVAPPNDLGSWVGAIAIDPAEHRLYALMVAPGANPSSGFESSLEILVYSTTPQGGVLVPPAGVPSGVLVDFRLHTTGFVDTPGGLAVDPGTHKVVVAGVADASQPDQTGVLQYVTDAGALSTRVSGLGAGLDPDLTGRPGPPGLAIGPDGAVYIPTLVQDGTNAAEIFRLPRETGTSTVVATDANQTIINPGSGAGAGWGGPIAVSPDGATVYITEDPTTGEDGRVRGFSTATGAQTVVYGGGTDTCRLPDGEGPHMGVATGSGDRLVVTNPRYSSSDPAFRAVHVFGTGGSGCPRPQALFTVAGSGDGTVTVTKGQTVAFDAGASQLQGTAPSQVDWDFDGSGQFATHVTGTPAALSTTHKFLQVGTIQVGVRVELDGAPPTDPVFHQVKVVAPVPTAAFKVSNRTPPAGASVTFDASDATDPAGSDTGGPSHALAKYRWDFGDGQTQETTTPTIVHAFANGAAAALSRTVRLVVVSRDDVASAAVQQTVTVAGVPVVTVPPTPAPVPRATPLPLPAPAATAPSPGVTATSVDAKGKVSLKVSCPAGGATCTGKVELTTKVRRKVKGKTTTTTVKLGSASFTVEAGRSTAVSLKLSAAGRSLLRKQRRLTATAAVSVTAGGKTSIKSKTLTLRAPAKKR